MTRFTAILVALAVTAGAPAVEAAVLRVPGDASNIKDAVAIANPGDTIEVGAGRWCGAYITKRVDLVGRDGAVIASTQDGASCDKPPMVSIFRVGLYLSSPEASGTTIRHFTFDGIGAQGTDGSAIHLGVYTGKDLPAKVDDVRVEHNTFLGTIQAISNWGGDNWVIRHNRIEGLTANEANGGVGILVSARNGGGQTFRPKGTSVSHNHVEGEVPATRLAAGAWFAGVRVASADETEVTHNVVRLEAPEGQTVPNTGVGVLVTNGVGDGSRSSTVMLNVGQKSEYVVVVTGPKGSNQPSFVRQNVGRTLLEGEESSTAGGPGRGRKDRRDDGHGLQ